MQNDLPKNPFKAALRQGQPQIGFWLTTASPASTEIAAGAGFDWLLIDMEHTTNELPDVAHHLRAAVGGTAEPVVRAPWNDPIVIKRLLDLGTRSLLFPFVQSAEEAQAAVRATRYPPHGIRGVGGTMRASRYGRVPDYFSRAADEICVMVQVESRKGIEALDEILAVDGVDGVFIGPSDLSADYGRPGRWTDPEVWDVIIAAGRRIRAAGRAAGFLSANKEQCQAVLDAGFQFVAVGIDSVILARQTEALAAHFKSGRT